MKKNQKLSSNTSLNEALIKSYVARAKLFYSVLKKKNVDNLISRVKECSEGKVEWNLGKLGISAEAFSIIKKSNVEPSQLFCHPDILSACPELLEYYRNTAALSHKGLGQLLSGKTGKATKSDSEERYRLIAKTLNEIISDVITDTEDFSLGLARGACLAEIGTEIQGTWVNIIGKGAAKAVEDIIRDYAKKKGFFVKTENKAIKIHGKKQKQTHIVLTNDWKIIFSSEPDVAIRDSNNKLKVAIEIKGSMDKAGAQTRLGEAKKSFTKAKAENAHTTTIYLASCFTDAVLSQLKTEREIDTHVNLIDILADEKKKQKFLEELFHYQIRIE